MAYRTRSRSNAGRGRSSYGARPARRSYSAARRAPARRTTARKSNTGRATARTQTVRIVVEGMPASAVSRRNPFENVLGAPQVAKKGPRKAAL